MTALAWNPRHPDLFACGYGSYAFEHQGGGGMVACFSLKDTATPQYTFAMGGCFPLCVRVCCVFF